MLVPLKDHMLNGWVDVISTSPAVTEYRKLISLTTLQQVYVVKG